MKSKSTIRLMTLLQLLSDQLDLGEKRRIEGRVREDSEALARLQKLRAAVGATRTLRSDAGVVDSTDGEDSLQRIAGFFDGTLCVEETIAFENECWESQELLHDVVVLFQSGLRSQPVRSVDSKSAEPLAQERLLRERLVGLFPAEPSVVPRMDGANTAMEAATRQSSLPLDSHDESIVDRTVVVVPRRSSRKTRTKTRFSNSTKIVIAIAVAMVASSIIIANWSSMRSTPTVVVEPPNESGGQDEPDPSPSLVRPNEIDHIDGDPESHQPERMVDLVNPNDLPRNADRELPDLIGPGARDVRAPDSLAGIDDPKTDLSPESVDKAVVAPAAHQAKLAWSWDRVEGLVAVREADSDVWTGALAEDDLRSEKAIDSENEREVVGRNVGLECRVLPLSWAQGSLKGLGSWTIAENTDFFVTSTPLRPFESQSANGSQSSPRPENTLGVRINLRSGRLAIANANVDSVVLIETTTGNWRIRITDPASIVIVEQGSNSRLFVQKGSVSVNATELKARQQMVRTRDGRLEQMSNRETIKWLRKPEHKFPSKQLSDQWLVSRDLFADWKLPNAISPEDQPLVRAALATIDPPGQAAMYLANVMPEVRAEGIHWLLAYGRDQRRLRKLAGELATELNSPGLATTLPRLVMAIHRKRWPSKTDTEMLISGLKNRNVSVRRLSHGFLVHLFGSVEDYDSESDAAIRGLQARKWLTAVNRLYRRLENANAPQR